MKSSPRRARREAGVTVEFYDVGREKQTFRATMEKLDGDDMWRAVRRQGVLGSNDLSFFITSDPGAVHAVSGVIFAGGCRRVGRWRVVEDAAKKPARPRNFFLNEAHELPPVKKRKKVAP